MLQKLIKAIELESKIFVPDAKEDLKMLSEQQKNAIGFNNLWQSLNHKDNIKNTYKVAYKLIEIGLALDEWYNGCDITVNPSAYLCLTYINNIAQKLNNHQIDEESTNINTDKNIKLTISEAEYISFYKELIDFAKPCIFYHTNKININKKYTIEEYEKMIIN